MDARTDNVKTVYPPQTKFAGGIRKPYIKSHLELQREITPIELAPSPYFFVLNICLAYMNMFARFDENPAMTLKLLKKQNITDGRTHTQTT